MLEAVGINPMDEVVYRALLAGPRQTVAELAKELDRTPLAVRRSVTALTGLGLVGRVAGRPVRLVAARPDVALDLLVAQRRQELNQVQLHARQLLTEMAPDEGHYPERVVEVLVGRQAVGNRFTQLLQATTTELTILDRPPYAADLRETDSNLDRLFRNGITVRGIYAPESLESPNMLAAALRAAQAGELSRVHPTVPIKLAISDRRLAVLPLSDDTSVDSALVIHPSALLDSLVALFEQLWRQAVPLVTTSQTRTGPVDDDDRRLVTLLAAGAKDDAIARQLGTSTRTVSRRVGELLSRLRARTRFQAGVLAEKHGWFAAEPQPPGGDSPRQTAQQSS
ncbi:helix-turn-helix domain-containing protein [Micromonosporaceae bacterium B7E4]